MCYPLIIYSMRGLKDFGDGTYQAARAIGPVIVIRPDKRDDAGLLAHELEHVKQFAVLAVIACALIALVWVHVGTVAGVPSWSVFPLGLGLHASLYGLVPEYRLWAEVEAYQVQAGYYADDRLPLFARFISEHYDLPITQASALQLLREK